MGPDNANRLTAVTVNGAGIVTVDTGNHNVVAVNAANANAGYIFKDNANLMGKIDDTAGGGGTSLTFEGSSTISGTVGQTNPFNKINLNGDANSVVNFQDAVEGDTIKVGAGTAKIDADVTGDILFDNNDSGTLLFDTAGNVTVTGAIKTDGAAVENQRGIIQVNTPVAGNTIQFTGGAIGNNANGQALKELNIASTNAATVVYLNDDAHIQEVNINNGTLQLGNGNNYKIHGINADTNLQGRLKINNGDATLIGLGNDQPVNFGSGEQGKNRLRELFFQGNNTLTIGKGINIFVNDINGNAGNQGKLEFAGTSVFSANQSTKALDTVTLAVDADVTFKTPIGTNVTVNGLTKLGDNSTLQISGNYNANGGIEGTNDHVGTTVKFINETPLAFDGTIGDAGGHDVATIEFAGSNVTFNDRFKHDNQTISFSGATATTITPDATSVLNTINFENNSTEDVVHTVVLTNAANNFTGNLAVANNNKQINFQLSNGKNVSINGGQAYGANFTTDTNGEGELTMNFGGARINQAGTDTKSLAKVQFANTGEITSGLFARHC